MGWMHDTLDYFGRDPVYRRFHHNELTFSLIYAWTENFMLPLSHDEVVHGKGSLLDRMPGDTWQKFANLRCLYGYMWAHPGKKLLFMGGEFGQGREWNHNQSLDWHLLEIGFHSGLKRLVADLNGVMAAEPALFADDCRPEGFEWVDGSNDQENVVIFLRKATGRCLLCAANLSPQPRQGYRVGLPRGGAWVEIINSDAEIYGGANLGNAGEVIAGGEGWHGQPYSALVTLPPLAVVWFSPQGQ
jgi:1,4-alpha-glucan branching enzyme